MIKTDKAIVSVAIDKIKLWKDNPRKNDAAVPKLTEIIKTRGQITPIVVWRKNGVCYKGNTTIKALRSLNIKTVSVLYADFPSESAAIAYGIADNKSSEWAEWDEDILSKFLKMEDVVETGFTAKETESFFDVSGTVQLTSGLDDFLAIKTILTIGLIYRKSNYLIVEDATTRFFLKNAGPDTVIDPQLLSVCGNANSAMCKMDTPLPEVNLDIIQKRFMWLVENKQLFMHVARMADFVSITEPCLSNVNFDEKLFATTGSILRYQDYDGKSKYSIAPESAQAIGAIIDKVDTVKSLTNCLWFSGPEFILIVNKIAAEPLNINGVIPKKVDGWIKPEYLLRALKTILPYVNSDTMNVFIDARGVYFVNGGRQFKVTIQTAFRKLTLLNIDAAIKCLENTTEMCVINDDEKIAFVAIDGDARTLCLKCNIRDAVPSFEYCVDIVSNNTTSETVPFEWPLKGGTLKGTVKGLSVESCKKFIAENFKC